ncbi:MAG: YggS family pyridoxal phosphate-dependent enzyme [Clostridia bacterium]|nr:YggS family pyridoxal phosphate-dependent enzyme [Clostridia bacterium]
MSEFAYIEDNLHALRREIDELSQEYGREVTLVAVTKSGSDEELVELVRSGAADIGENRPGELRRRGDLLKSAGLTPTLHEIGNLQRNKVKLIIESVGLIHSLDNMALAAEIDKQAARVGRRVPVLIEINSAREEQKDGVLPEDAEDFFLKVRDLPNISVAGLMTMGPVCDEPEEIRPYFRLTRELFDRLNRTYGFEGGILSMGMSDSYRIAIEEGSTLVRVGRKLFNRR